MKTYRMIGTILMILLASGDCCTAETGMTRWFSCGIGFWRTCVPTPDSALPAPPRTDDEQAA